MIITLLTSKYANINTRIILLLIIGIIIPIIVVILKSLRIKVLKIIMFKNLSQGDSFLSEGKYSEALPYYLKQYKFAKKTWGMSNSETISICLSIAKTYLYLSKPKLAEQYAYSAKDYHENILKNDYKKLIAYYTLLGNIQDNLKEYDKALIYYNKIADICNELGESANMDLAKCYLNTAITYDRMNEYDDAWVKYTAAIRIFEDSGEDNQSEIALSYFNLGISSFIQKKNNEALVQFNKSLDIRLNLLNNHPDIASCYHYIGCSYFETDMVEEAVELLFKALYIRLITIGHEHPRYLDTYLKLKEAYIASNSTEDGFAHWIEDHLDEKFNENQ